MNQYLFGAAVVPSLLILWYFVHADRNPEPRAVLLRTFVYGVLTTIPAGLLEMAICAGIGGLAPPPLANAAGEAFLSAALCEELLKFWVLYGYASKHAAFDEPMDGIVYGVTASLGFATLENVLYVAQHGMGVAIFRAVLAVPGHACWGAIMGWFVGQSRFGPPAARSRNIALALGVPMALHGGYDFPLMALDKLGVDGGLSALALAVPPLLVFFGWRFALRRVKSLQAQQVGEVVPATAAPEWRAPAADLPETSAGGGALRATGGWMLMLTGGGLASIGGIMLLGLAMTLGSGKGDRDQLAGAIVAALLFGGAPLLLGAWLFRRGMKLLHRPARQN